MKTFILRPRRDLDENNNPWEPWYNKSFGFIIRAENEKEAREIAQESGGDETNKKRKAWGERYSTCVELEAITDKGVIMQDFAKA